MTSKAWDKGAMGGKQTYFIPARAFHPTVTDGCAYITDFASIGYPDLSYLAFDAAVDEHAQADIALPKQWDEGTLTYRVYWLVNAAVSTGVAWSLKGVSVSDNEAITTTPYGTSIVVTDNAQGTALEVLVSVESTAIILAGTPAEGDFTFLDISRDVSDANDDMTQDAWLIGVDLFWLNNTGVDT